ncbi:unnamed protein product [Sphenostylis stenocarpa]|uniref:Uncharacterized protein n=1 Tax=Sphenostylis stenocarpa TaxID=92480 RepID=A0AA86W0G5_9FABA|nr:unnamed protein product [Sphenostylis stenocarpa]
MKFVCGAKHLKSNFIMKFVCGAKHLKSITKFPLSQKHHTEPQPIINSFSALAVSSKGSSHQSNETSV